MGRLKEMFHFYIKENQFKCLGSDASLLTFRRRRFIFPFSFFVESAGTEHLDLNAVRFGGKELLGFSLF